MTRRCRVAAGIAMATAQVSTATSCTAPPAPAHIAHDTATADDTLTAAGWVVETVPAPPTTEEPTTTTTEPAPAPAQATAPPATRRPTTTTVYPPPPQGQTTRQGAAPLACIRSYEGGYGTNTGNGYYGAYQFDLPTWRSVGGTGLPSDASPAEQDMRAQMLYDRRGLAPWPTPAVMCR